MRTSRRISRTLWVILLIGGCLVIDPVASEEPGTQTPSPQEQKETIHRILEQSEQVLTGRGFTYDPAGRRDPFRSLLHGSNDARRGPRPQGIAGMLINEVDLVGIVEKPAGSVAFFNGTDNKGYFLHLGDDLYDGKIIRIDQGEGSVVFRQEVDDPRAIKPYREVTKRLKPVKEGGL
jgi:Tfp pilus assembly protein PilP